jgi:Raf kinase inhibitor-like YbhB/YbcL family protein
VRNGWLVGLIGIATLVTYVGVRDASPYGMTLSIRSPAFDAGRAIPRKYTCEGTDVSPPLGFSGVPDTAKSLVFVVDDPDAPDPKAPRRTWVHWVLYNLPADVAALPENALGESLPRGTRVALNDWKRAEYRGPCPPIGRHRYFHKLYALDIQLPDLGAHAAKADVEVAMTGHILAEAVLIGTYEKTTGQ